MAQFINTQDLMKYLKRITRYPLEQVAIKVEEILKSYITENWYNRMTPEDYSRTYDFLNCISIKPIKELSNGWQIEIFFDIEKINPSYADEDRTWNKHMSVYGVDISEYIPEWIENGNNSPIYNYEGIHMVRNTVAYCEQYSIPVKGMIKELKKYGFNIK